MSDRREDSKENLNKNNKRKPETRHQRQSSSDQKQQALLTTFKNHAKPPMRTQKIATSIGSASSTSQLVTHPSEAKQSFVEAQKSLSLKEINLHQKHKKAESPTAKPVSVKPTSANRDLKMRNQVSTGSLNLKRARPASSTGQGALRNSSSVNAVSMFSAAPSKM